MRLSEMQISEAEQECQDLPVPKGAFSSAEAGLRINSERPQPSKELWPQQVTGGHWHIKT